MAPKWKKLQKIEKKKYQSKREERERESQRDIPETESAVAERERGGERESCVASCGAEEERENQREAERHCVGVDRGGVAVAVVARCVKKRGRNWERQCSLHGRRISLRFFFFCLTGEPGQTDGPVKIKKLITWSDYNPKQKPKSYGCGSCQNFLKLTK